MPEREKKKAKAVSRKSAPSVKKARSPKTGAGKPGGKARPSAAAARLFGEAELKSLRAAFETFQRQSDTLERSHDELKERLAKAQDDLSEKNRRLAATVAELESMKLRLSGILDSLSDAVMTIGRDGAIHCANGAARELLERCGLADKPSLVKATAIRDALVRKRVENAPLVEMDTPEGRRRYILTAILMKKGGSDGELVVTLKDVTELMELQERLGREDRLAALGRVAASVAHEIRNPLGAIEGFGILLERDLRDNPSLRSLASKSVYAARQLNSVVSNLLSYTREVRVSAAPCEARSLVEGALDFVKPMADDRKIALRLEELDGSPLPVMADQRQIGQVLINVMINAFDACRGVKGAEVRVACLPSPSKPSFVRMEISDNGPGVPSGLKKRVFEPFFTTKDGGTGLGLSLCQRIVEAHGGSISETGEEGQGARFVIELKAPGART